ncbi:DUF998 domain-containing protein [Lentiprolixibacter aurantiacus]|uniref:DUF998 domain-containing protein n=1 Tax=Lentiprolixibacter aurantiacus TaxID=2993939 RepID=A0AAE3MJ88_9FLAO|nr:DUF998 domain-containing protein [Lentiprolixibacter aurantiacus]MCX2718444.1 DUF998 domain-containing protein [Lentiprolixibacter aurantiacus]
MKTKQLLSLGWITALLFITGTFILGSLVRDYSFVAQTVSEIGQQGSPQELSWQIFSILIGLLIILFSFGLIAFARRNNWSVIPAIFVLFAGLSQFGTALFPSPHPLHNVFGLSMTIGYFSPLVFGLPWKNKLGGSFRGYSLLAFGLIMIGIFLNLSPLFAHDLYPLEYYGLVQRFLLFTFYLYLGYVGVVASKRP